MQILSRLFSRLTLLTVIALVGVLLWDRINPPPPPPISEPVTEQIDRILIEKSARSLTVFRDGKEVKTYQIALGFAPDGDKQQEGDGKTPEGVLKLPTAIPKAPIICLWELIIRNSKTSRAPRSQASALAEISSSTVNPMARVGL